jgi:hypothetical protein
MDGGEESGDAKQAKQAKQAKPAKRATHERQVGSKMEL